MASPTLRRKTLGIELRRLRSAKDLSVEEIADLLGCSTGKVSHFENGRNAPSKAELMVLMDHYDVPADRRLLLEEIRNEARKRGWWSTYRLPAWFRDYIGLETDASKIRTFEIELIPGLLQTEEYARAINMLGRHIVKPNDVERQVAVRMERQKRLLHESPIELTAVISEAALARCASDPTIAANQFDRLIEMSGLANVTLHVLPFDSGLYNSMTGSFTLLDFPPDAWPQTAYQEYAVGGHLVDDRRVVAELCAVFDELRNKSLNESDSVQLIKKHASEER